MGYSQPAPNYNYANQQGYATVTVTNRAQNGYRDDVVSIAGRLRKPVLRWLPYPHRTVLIASRAFI